MKRELGLTKHAPRGRKSGASPTVYEPNQQGNTGVTNGANLRK